MNEYTPPLDLTPYPFGALYTLGYTEPDAGERLNMLMEQPRTALLDIRYSPRSRWASEWNKKALQERFGRVRYMHIQALGNVNYNKPGLPIQLLNPDEVIPKCVRTLQQGWSLILLCACKDYERCHRKVVYEHIQAAVEAAQLYAKNVQDGQENGR